MIEALAIPGVCLWSRWQPERRMCFNSHLFLRPSGNVAVDPLPLDDAGAAEVHQLGGIALIAITNRDHARDASALKERFGAKIVTSQGEASALPFAVDGICSDGEELFDGAFVVALEHQKTAGEFALHLPKERMVLVGDALIGSPPGRLSLLPDQKYGAVTKAALGLRRLAVLLPEILLVGDGTNIYSDAATVLWTLLRERGGPQVSRINLDELRFEDFVGGGGDYRGAKAEVGWWIGANKLGYQVVKLPPAAKYCPLHSHVLEEELFFVLEGRPSIRTPDGTIECRRGDFIAFPVGPKGTHQLLNRSDREAIVLLLGLNERNEVCFYPDSNKVLIDPDGLILRAAPALDYYDGE